MTPEQRILHVLAASDHKLYDLDFVNAGVAKRRWLYVVLGRMEESGLIEGREESEVAPPQLPRRLYRITDAGRATLLPVAKVHP